MSREVALIVAHDLERAIGRAGQLPWHLPDDLRRFKALTLGHTVVMGRKTFESIGRPLPGRQNWVLTRDPAWRASGIERFDSWEQALLQHRSGLLWVIGGGEIYRAALADVERIESTEVDTRIAGADTWFPALSAADWTVVSRESRHADEDHAFSFELVTRRRRHA